MDWRMAVFLGVLQGITEWLPISSSGHLAIFQFYFEEEPPILFDIILHLGSLCVIMHIMKDELKQVVSEFPSFISNFRDYSNYKGNQRLIGMIIVASIPTAIIGLTFNGTIIEAFYSEMHLVGGCLIFTGLLIWFSKNFSGDKQIDDFPFKNALVVGFFQGLAILPGISRSGSTIAISKILGMDPVRAARFSFLLFIPAIVGATLLKFKDIDETILEVGVLSIILGFISSVVTSYFSINLLLELIKKQQFHYFTPYCLVLGIFLIYIS
ncbi:MAG TPA: undecaprenyl-diphosphate phosphatase [Candidatus Poseidoniia archaeon]|jgi:undecaprenyl-diphosphatase|nr:undecaprenyl-diphosphate phosphatase [Candidatus Poseidoniia archaeon]|tara:strand:+ start:1916 stop:2719 length:804 start_codon:yes stop_codon:yes gene_type:complete